MQRNTSTRWPQHPTRRIPRLKNGGIRPFLLSLIGVVLLSYLSSCRAYRNRIMFATEQSPDQQQLANAIAEANRNYTIRENDFLEMDVYTNDGELLIDPNFEIMQEIGRNGQNQQFREQPRFLVEADGTAKLPLVGDVPLAGLTLSQADSALEARYSAFYENPYVITRYINKRVIVLGATQSQVIPLQNENTNLIEVLALAGGIVQGRTDNVRLIRGNLNEPEVHVIDLSTIAGMQIASLRVQPGDIIYVQPIQRVTAEVVRDISPILGLVTSLATIVLLVLRF